MSTFGFCYNQLTTDIEGMGVAVVVNAVVRSLVVLSVVGIWVVTDIVFAVVVSVVIGTADEKWYYIAGTLKTQLQVQV